jgi:hypothetical protein
MMARARKKYVVCLSNKGYEAALERHKIYVALGKTGAEGKGLLRVIDESGEDYLYAADRFAEIELPRKVARAISASV